MSVEEILTAYKRNEAFYRDGGITVTGGEPLWQIEFVTELFKAAKAQGIHTCLDTSGITFDPEHPHLVDDLLSVTDLVMLDIKHIDPEKHEWLTAQKFDHIKAFAAYLNEKAVPVWIRHVYVNDEISSAMDLFHLGEFIGQFSNVKALDVLPYHTMGIAKYIKLGIPYRLEGVPQATAAQAKQARIEILKGMRKARSQKKEQEKVSD